MDEVKYHGKIRYKKAEVADEYDMKRFSSVKGRLTDKLEKYWIKKALKVANVQGRVLDLPCGTGRMTEMLLRMGHIVTAGDISERMMNHAKERIKSYADRVQFQKCDLEDIKFGENVFDLILTVRLLHHIPESIHNKVLQQLYRTTKKWVIISFSNKYTLQSIKRDIISIFTNTDRYSIAPSSFKREVNEAGFKIVKYYPIMPIISESVFVLLEK